MTLVDRDDIERRIFAARSYAATRASDDPRSNELRIVSASTTPAIDVRAVNRRPTGPEEPVNSPMSRSLPFDGVLIGPIAMQLRSLIVDEARS